jgi:hypothetical protein
MPIYKNKLKLKKKNLSKLVGGAGASSMSEEVLNMENINEQIELLQDLKSKDNKTFTFEDKNSLLLFYLESKQKLLNEELLTTKKAIDELKTQSTSKMSHKRSLPHPPSSNSSSSSRKSTRKLPQLPSKASFVKPNEEPSTAPPKPPRLLRKHTKSEQVPRAGIPIPFDLPPHKPLILPTKKFSRRTNAVGSYAINSMHPPPKLPMRSTTRPSSGRTHRNTPPALVLNKPNTEPNSIYMVHKAQTIWSLPENEIKLLREIKKLRKIHIIDLKKLKNDSFQHLYHQLTNQNNSEKQNMVDKTNTFFEEQGIISFPEELTDNKTDKDINKMIDELYIAYNNLQNPSEFTKLMDRYINKYDDKKQENILKKVIDYLRQKYDESKV